MKKLLIVEHVKIMADALAEALAENWDVVVCSEGCYAVGMMESIRPDAMVIDLGLPCMDGLAVLSEAFPHLPPFTIALSSAVTDTVYRAATGLGVDYVFEIPVDMSTIKAVLNDASLHQITARRTNQHLRALGFRAGLDGYICIVAAMPYILEDPARKLGCEVYGHVARICGLTDHRDVERAIRFAITDAWRRRKIQDWANYFPLNKNQDVDRPKNKDLIRSLMMVV